MKLTTILKPMLLFCLIFSIQVQAQNNYPVPSQERVETLLEKINTCKMILEQFENSLKTIENNPTNYTYADYIQIKGFKESSEQCVATSRKELDAIRKDYPGWFNNPGVIMPLSNRQEISPEELERLEKALKEIANLRKRFAAIPIPED